jgi:large subunit ribosomal protein L28
MAKCENCGKGPQFGHNVSHSHVKTNRRWSPNIQKVTVVKDGQRKRMSICAKCLKTLHKID